MKEYKKDIAKYVMMPAMAKRKHPIVEKRRSDLAMLAETTDLNKVIMGDTKIGIITAGISYQYAREVFGDKASYLKLGLIYPLPVNLIKDFAAKVDKLYVIEELDDIIETHCKKIGVSVTGKEIFPAIRGIFTKIDCRKDESACQRICHLRRKHSYASPPLCAQDVRTAECFMC